MRGRATRVALPALIVLVLVAVVAVVATGSVSRGSSVTRAPSRTLLDALFTLSLLAVVAGAILLVYGLFQRKEIARQIVGVGALEPGEARTFTFAVEVFTPAAMAEAALEAARRG